MFIHINHINQNQNKTCIFQKKIQTKNKTIQLQYNTI